MQGKAQARRPLILQGIDPIDAKREQGDARKAAHAKRMTLQQCAHGDTCKNTRQRRQWGPRLETYAGPVVGDMNVTAVHYGPVLQVPEPIWKSKTATASRSRLVSTLSCN